MLIRFPGSKFKNALMDLILVLLEDWEDVLGHVIGDTVVRISHFLHGLGR